jgi:hypothetical protein
MAKFRQEAHIASPVFRARRMPLVLLMTEQSSFLYFFHLMGRQAMGRFAIPLKAPTLRAQHQHGSTRSQWESSNA